MVVLSEKDIVPPPPYFAIEYAGAGAAYAPESKSSPFPSSLSSSSSASHSLHGARSSTGGLGSTQPRRPTAAAPSLPSHVHLLIVYSTLPTPGALHRGRHESAGEHAVRMTRTLYWMAFCLRLVNRGFYLASMHLLRSTFLSYYARNVRPPYSSDPFPHTSLSSHGPGAGSARGSVVSSLQCESQILDLYIMHQLHEDVFADDSSLHTARPDTLHDLFDFMQPRARLTDLVRAFGAAAGLIYVPGMDDSRSLEREGKEDEEVVADTDAGWEVVDAHEASGRTTPRLRASCSSVRAAVPPTNSKISNNNPPPAASLKLKARLARSSSSLTLAQAQASPSPSLLPSQMPAPQRKTRRPIRRTKIPHTALRISFSPRRVGLMYMAYAPSAPSSAPPRTVVDLPRAHDEPLERCASRLVAGLKAWLDACEGEPAHGR